MLTAIFAIRCYLKTLLYLTCIYTYTFVYIVVEYRKSPISRWKYSTIWKGLLVNLTVYWNPLHRKIFWISGIYYRFALIKENAYHSLFMPQKVQNFYTEHTIKILIFLPRMQKLNLLEILFYERGLNEILLNKY